MKFRIYDKTLKGYIKDTSNIWINPSLTYTCEWRPDLDGQTVFQISDNWVFQQSTGLADKQGVEIFEGDILTTKHTGQSPYDRSDSKLRRVLRREYDNQLHLFSMDEDRWPASGFGLNTSTRSRFMVVGNIFEGLRDG